MKKALYTLSLLAALLGCGQPVNITYHYNTPQEEVNHLCGDDGYQHLGYAWREKRYDGDDLVKGNSYHWDCDIWLIPQDQVHAGCWDKLVGHEQRHCYEGDFHKGFLVDACTGATITIGG